MTDTEEQSKYEAILDLLEEEGPLSTHQVVERLNARGTLINGTGQALHRLRGLERRGRIERIAGDRPDWKRWQIVGS